jgi:hypothetical protein
MQVDRFIHWRSARNPCAIPKGSIIVSAVYGRWEDPLAEVDRPADCMKQHRIVLNVRCCSTWLSGWSASLRIFFVVLVNRLLRQPSSIHDFDPFDCRMLPPGVAIETTEWFVPSPFCRTKVIFQVLMRASRANSLNGNSGHGGDEQGLPVAIRYLCSRLNAMPVFFSFKNRFKLEWNVWLKFEAFLSYVLCISWIDNFLIAVS